MLFMRSPPAMVQKSWNQKVAAAGEHDQRQRGDARADIRGDHQSAGKLDHAGRDRHQLRRRHAGRALKLRGETGKLGGNGRSSIG